MKLLKPEEAADILGVQVGTLKKWRQKKKGPKWLRVGPKLIRYRTEDVNTFLEKAEK